MSETLNNNNNKKKTLCEVSLFEAINLAILCQMHLYFILSSRMATIHRIISIVIIKIFTMRACVPH